jgi:methylase of polypeptide subunit release factors
MLRELIISGSDPLGDAISKLRTPIERRRRGAIYTPWSVVYAMVEWAIARNPVRFVDPGCGSGRFASLIARRSPRAEILAIDVDPLATLACRAVLACCGARNARVINADFVSLQLSKVKGRTAFIGNPPYVRHHDLTQRQKRAGKAVANSLKLKLSGLAGLHVYFLLTALRGGSDGDVACFITSAEWLDVGYGQVVRQALLDRATGVSIHVVSPQATVFPDIMTTAVFTCLEMGQGDGPVRFRALRSLGGLDDLEKGGRYLPREAVARSHRWGALARNGVAGATPRGARLGDVVRVSRGAVTGCNRFFLLAKSDVDRLRLADYVVPVVRSAQEVLEAQGALRSSQGRCFLLDPPKETRLELPEHERLRSYLALGERDGYSNRYICTHRKPWWHVGAKTPPIVATYMARQPPAFAHNPQKLAIVNVLHGLYPRVFMDRQQLKNLVAYLNAHRDRLRGAGRTYHGGLEKFEPSEMEAFEIPLPADVLGGLVT